VDDFFPKEFAETLLAGFPALEDKSWDYSHDQDIEVKYRSNWKSEFDIPDPIVSAVRILNSSQFLNSLSEVMEIHKIIPDPYFTGGGLNVSAKSGILDVHVDGNYHDSTGLNRRLNVLLYLNKDWNPEWGGQFGLFDENGDKCIKKIEPIFNRLVVFETHDRSFHGFPEPLNVPDGITRKSLILYYYTVEKRPEHLVTVEEPHSALWKNRSFLDKRGNKTRNFT
jgi:Rps23 Pro-64 3,4-dihydroxylase Tpa1-like proline 4-hydroxylase